MASATFIYYLQKILRKEWHLAKGPYDQFSSAYCRQLFKHGAIYIGEYKIEFEKVLGYHQHNRAGFIKQTEVPPKQTRDYPKLVSDKVDDLEEEWYSTKALQIRLQGNWTSWCNYGQNELSWKHLLITTPRLSSFMLGATADTLPSPMNLKCRHITTEADCSLCSVNICTTAHVLFGCKVAHSQGRYSFCRVSILRVLPNSLSKLLSSMSPVKACTSLSSCSVKWKRFCSCKKKPCVGILHDSSDWKLLSQALYSPQSLLSLVVAQILLFQR